MTQNREQNRGTYLNTMFSHRWPCSGFLCYVTNCHKHSVLKRYTFAISLLYTLSYCMYPIPYILLFLRVKNLTKSQLDSLDSGCNSQNIRQATFSSGGPAGEVCSSKLSHVVSRFYFLVAARLRALASFWLLARGHPQLLETIHIPLRCGLLTWPFTSSKPASEKVSSKIVFHNLSRSRRHIASLLPQSIDQKQLTSSTRNRA